MGGCVAKISDSSIEIVALKRAEYLAKSLDVWKSFKYRESVKGQDSHAKHTFRRLGLNDDRIQGLYNYFRIIDVQGSDSIIFDEFLDFFKLSKTPFTKRVFKLLDDNREMAIDFEEFVVGIWNFASADPQHLILFAFLLYDETGEGKMTKDQFREFVEEVYHGTAKKNLVESMWSRFDKDNNHTIELLEFTEGCARRKNLLWPAFTMQTHLREKMFGLKWWYRESERRQIDPRLQNLHIHEILMHEEERFGVPKAIELGKADARKERDRNIEKAAKLSKKRDMRFDSHSCVEEDLRNEIAEEVKLHDYNLQKEIYRKKHGFSPSKHVMRERKRFKRRRREHHHRKKKKKKHEQKIQEKA
eukprot:g2055.t1